MESGKSMVVGALVSVAIGGFLNYLAMVSPEWRESKTNYTFGGKGALGLFIFCGEGSPEERLDKIKEGKCNETTEIPGLKDKLEGPQALFMLGLIILFIGLVVIIGEIVCAFAKQSKVLKITSFVALGTLEVSGACTMLSVLMFHSKVKAGKVSTGIYFAIAGAVFVNLGGGLALYGGRNEVKTMTSGQIEPGEMTSGQLESGAMTGGQMEQREMAGGQLESWALTGGQMEPESMTSSRVQSESMTSGRVQSESMTSGQVTGSQA